MGIAITQVDAFADKPFAGNPAAVCILAHFADERWMQSVAREMNLSETAFLVRRDGDFDLRWFTPTVEVKLCGHATLASAHVLWQEGHLRLDQQARFHTRSGLLTAEKKGAWIEMDFPAISVEPVARLQTLEAALGTTARQMVRTPLSDYLVELDSEAAVRALKPDFGALRAVDVRGVIVTSLPSSPQYDFVSRFFAPGAGIDEDPVTGSAHCCLAPFWKERLGRDELLGYQASARGGFVRTRCVGDRVMISGQAVTVLHGDLIL
jgi:PhzF family phenazine biosynthesis protein